MGTRADFYVGRGENAEYLGSVGWDGHQENMLHLESKFEAQYRLNVKDLIDEQEGWTKWPWPWEDSHTTDYSYAFDDDRVWVSCFGTEWIPLLSRASKDVVFPKMRAAKLVF